MNKKLLVLSILSIFMLLAISMASAVNTTTSVKKKESPLFRIRTRQAIKEKIGDVIGNIKTKFIGQRVFFLPFLWLRNIEYFSVRQRLNEKTGLYVTSSCWTWEGPCEYTYIDCTEVHTQYCEPCL